MCVPTQAAGAQAGGTNPGQAINPDIMQQAENIDPAQAAKALQKVTEPKKLKK